MVDVTRDVMEAQMKTKLKELPIKEQLKKSIVEYIDNADMCVDNVNILQMLPFLLKLQNDKARLYGRSWCKHGDMSAFFNIERKWDRISNIMENAMENGLETLHSKESATATETFLDTVVDLGLYGLMWSGFIAEKHPEEFDAFMESNHLK